MQPDLPADMIDRAARAIAGLQGDAAVFNAVQYAGSQWDGYRDQYRNMSRRVLAAALEGCGTHTEYGVRSTLYRRDLWYGTTDRDRMLQTITARDGERLISRLVITTRPTEETPDA